MIPIRNILSPAFFIFVLVLFTISVSYSQNEWKQLPNGFYGGHVISLATVDETIFAGTLGGLFRSSDNGNTWIRIGEGLPGQSVYSMVTVSNTLYVALNGGGPYLSDDLGETWQPIIIPESKIIGKLVAIGETLYGISGDGLLFSFTHSQTNATEINTGVEGVSSLESSGTTLFLGSYSHGLYFSTNAGSTWTKYIDYPGINGVFALDSDGSVIIAWTNLSMLISTNEGVHWTSMNNPYIANTIHVMNNNVLLAGTVEHASISYDNGFSWIDAPNLPGMSCITSNTAGTYVGSFSGIFRSLDGGTTWDEANTGITSANVRSVVMLNNKLFASSFNMIYRSLDLGNSWQRLNTPIPYGQGIMSLHVSGPNILAGTFNEGTFVSSDEGVTWNQVNLAGATSFAQHGTDVYASSISGIFVSKDYGMTWSFFSNVPFANVITVLGNDLFTATSTLQRISLTNANHTPVEFTAPQNITSFATINNQLFCGSNVGVFVSNDRGETWTTLNNALSGNYFVSALTTFEDYLYLGRPGQGAHYSRNNSGFWTDYNAGFPSMSVYLMSDISKLTVLGGKLYAGTSSAGVWSICPILKAATITPANILTQTPTLTSSAENGNQWYFNGAVINGATNQTIILDKSGVYHVVVTTPAGCKTPPSAEFEISICPPLEAPTITVTNILSETPTLTSSAENGNQWYFNGTAINGATSKSITVDESGVYHVVVITPSGCQSLPSADLEVSICPLLEPPTITITNILSETPILTSSAENGNQWYFNGTAINGATSKSITIDESGAYHVVVTTPAGCQSPPSAVQEIVIVGDIYPLKSLGLDFHPNPTNQQLNIDLVNFEPHQPLVIEIFDLQGKALVKLNGFGGQLILHETTSYSSGIYIIRCTQGNSVYTSRFIKLP
ncbi:MAG: T9SS type A sorting domain-containing protein [Cyclobacteriaceae bacterium]